MILTDFVCNCRHLTIIHIDDSLFIFHHLCARFMLISQTVAGGGPMVGLLTSLSETQRQHEALCGDAGGARGAQNTTNSDGGEAREAGGFLSILSCKICTGERSLTCQIEKRSYKYMKQSNEWRTKLFATRKGYG